MHEALEVDGEHKVELLFTPIINQDVHAVFLTQIAQSDPSALHVVVMDQSRIRPHHTPEDQKRSSFGITSFSSTKAALCESCLCACRNASD